MDSDLDSTTSVLTQELDSRQQIVVDDRKNLRKTSTFDVVFRDQTHTHTQTRITHSLTLMIH